jgi:muramoyltetrapeptide carboxypeptidase
MRKPRALKDGDRIAVVAPASSFSRDEFERGIAELRTLGFEPVYDDSVFDRDPGGYVAGPAPSRANAFMTAWADPSIAALVAVRGGYGSVQMLPWLDPALVRQHAKAFIGYSDTTSLLTWLTQQGGLVAFHGPMLEGRLARGAEGYDRDSFTRCLRRPQSIGEITHDGVEVIRAGEAAGMLVGGTLTQLTASLGTPYAFDPPQGHVLFIDEVGERPFRIDRMLTQLRLSGLLGRAAAVVFNELPRCDEPGGPPTARSVVANLLQEFPGPVLYGLRSGHTLGAMMTLPFGVRARVLTGARPGLLIEESAVE